MMERSFSAPQLDRNRLELRPLLSIQHCVDSFHISGEPGDRQKLPALTARNIMHAAIVTSRVVQSYPAAKVCHRLRPGPVRVILMPGYATTMKRRLAEELIVPETDRPFKQLRRRHGERRVPQQIVKRRRDPPRAQRVKERSRRVRRFIRVIFVEQVISLLRRIDERRELLSQYLDLFMAQHSDARDVAVFFVERDLVVAQAKGRQFFSRVWKVKKAGDRLVTS